MEEITSEYLTKRNKFLDSLAKNFDDYYSNKHKDLDEILDYVNYSDRFVKFLISRDNLNFSADIELRKINDSLALAVKIYLIDKAWNEGKAKDWLLRAITAILSEDYSFNGVRFTKGNKSVLKSKI